jgi:hypothetical protein
MLMDLKKSEGPQVLAYLEAIDTKWTTIPSDMRLWI